MPRYLLDTNILTDLEYPETPAYQTIMNKISSLSEESEVCFSIISAYTAIEKNAIVISDDQIFQKIQEFYPSLRFENWKEG